MKKFSNEICAAAAAAAAFFFVYWNMAHLIFCHSFYDLIWNPLARPAFPRKKMNELYSATNNFPRNHVLNACRVKLHLTMLLESDWNSSHFCFVLVYMNNRDLFWDREREIDVNWNDLPYWNDDETIVVPTFTPMTVVYYAYTHTYTPKWTKRGGRWQSERWTIMYVNKVL